MWAQLQWLHRTGLGLWSTGDLFKHWYFWQNCFWTAASWRCRVVRKRGVWWPQAGASQEQGVRNAKSCRWQVLPVLGERCMHLHQPNPAINLSPVWGGVAPCKALCKALEEPNPNREELPGILMYQGYPAIMGSRAFLTSFAPWHFQEVKLTSRVPGDFLNTRAVIMVNIKKWGYGSCSFRLELTSSTYWVPWVFLNLCHWASILLVFSANWCSGRGWHLPPVSIHLVHKD